MRKSTGELLAARFWVRVSFSEGCWLWTGGHAVYGNLKVEGKTVSAHRVAWQITSGPIPDGLRVLHHCDTPLCVRPDHLFLGTQSDNLKDMVSKGRGLTASQQAAIQHPRGDDHWMRRHPERIARGSRGGGAKLTNNQVLEIRRLRAEGWTLKRLSLAYGVRLTNIQQIVTRQTWKHI